MKITTPVLRGVLRLRLAPELTRESIEKVDADLSPRGGGVLQLVAKGATNKEIADSLFISENTVKTHLKSIMDKLYLSKPHPLR